MEQRPSSEAAVIVHSVSREISRLLLNKKVHYRVYKPLPPSPIVSQMNPVHTLQPYFPKVNFNIILTSTLMD
jgi:hypothetical protein